MHPALAEFPSRRFYQSRLRSAVSAAERPPPRGVRWPNATCAAAFVDVAGAEALVQSAALLPPNEADGAPDADADGDGGRGGEGGGGGKGGRGAGGGGKSGASGSYSNAAEAAALAAAVGAVLAAGELSAAELGVITPYAAQVAACGPYDPAPP